jgi:hypothetical protein
LFRAVIQLATLLRSARPRVDRFIIVFRVRRAGGGGDVFPRTGAGINESGGAELIERSAVETHAFALIVGRKRSPTVRAFLPLEAEPFQVVEHGGDEFWFAAGAIQVFVAEDQFAAVQNGALLRSPESPRVAEVQVAGG